MHPGLLRAEPSILRASPYSANPQYSNGLPLAGGAAWNLWLADLFGWDGRTGGSMPLTIALEALKAAYRGQCSWLTAWANELEAGRIRVVSGSNGVSIDITAQTARDYRHRAHNLE